MNNLIILSVDGSSLIKNKKYESSSACSIYINNEHVCDFGVYHKNGTISLGELYSMVLGLDRLSEIISDNDPLLNDSDILIVSDSEYVVKSLNSYIYSWIKQGFDNIWKSSKGDDIAYQELFKYIYKTYHNGNIYNIKSIPVSIYHISGHITNYNKSIYDKFNIKNKSNISKELFENFIKYNNHSDELANEIRLNKNIYFEKRGNTKWLKKEKRMNTRNGKIVILPRNKRRN